MWRIVSVLETKTGVNPPKRLNFPDIGTKVGWEGLPDGCHNLPIVPQSHTKVG